MAGLKKFLVAATVLGGLAACAPTEVDVEVNYRMNAPDTAFQDAVSREYVNLAEKEMAEVDWKKRDGQGDADWFLERADVTGNGTTIDPVVLSTRNLTSDWENELSAVRNRIMTAFDNGARVDHPAIAAQAQAMFDCWVEEAEENTQPDDIALCRNLTLAALDKLEPKAVAAAPAPKPAPAPAPEPAQPEILAGPFYVYFEFDSALVDETATEPLTDTLKAHQEFQFAKVFVRGHTDSSGTNDYNARLAQRRADAVTEALIGMGIPTDTIVKEAYGEDRLKVPTGDQQKLRTNRRVEIWLTN